MKTVGLATDFIVLECSRYTVFDDFVTRFGELLEIVGKHTELPLSERIGLRYVDLVRTRQGESLSDYLKPGLLALPPEELGAAELLYRFEMLAITPIGQFVLRLLQTDDGTFLPLGIERSDLEFDVAVAAGEVISILDIDHFSNAQRDFDPQALVAELWRLHDYTDRAFRSAVTETALARWGAIEI